ncbi:MAG: chemotaxis protein MotB [Roseovarius sp.]|nr:chemotaxis protein MotB [Roseovarius sp.]MBK46068.1 chemotaxis protein MotB [Roseovarius sp.]
MDARSNAAPVIIKRKKIVAGGGHHGGAWKVAYADFVTAMMAFFLLMWLLGATTEKQRKGIADYFSPTVPVNRVSGGGSGAFGGDSVFSEETLAQSGTGASSRNTTDSRQARGDLGTAPEGAVADESLFAEVQSTLSARSGESLASDELLRHILTRVTDEGLVIEISDRPGVPLFAQEGAEPMPLLHRITALVAPVLELARNDIAIAAHTRARPVILADNPVWELSAARANRMRHLLEEAGTGPARMRRVTGHADRSPAVANPMDPRNNRVEVIVLRSD